MGVFGGIGLFLALLLKMSALASMPTERVVPVIVLSATLGRWFLILAGFQPLARPGGMGADHQSHERIPACGTPIVTLFPIGWSANWQSGQ